MGRDAGGVATDGAPGRGGVAAVSAGPAEAVRHPARCRRAVPVAVAVITVLALSAACGDGPASPVGAPPTSTTSGPAPTTPVTPGSVTPGPGPWSTPVVVAAGRHLGALSCPTPTFCMALDDLGAAYTFNGASWSSGQALVPGAAIEGKVIVSCTGPTFCVAAPTGNQVDVWTGTWGPPVALPAPQRVQALSCASPKFCMAIDAQGDAFVDDGTRWSGVSGVEGGPSAVSCPGASFCAATVGESTATWQGTSWGAQPGVDSTGQLLSVSCPSATFCMAGDSDGSVVEWNGISWSAPQTIDPGTSTSTADNVLTGVSCSGTTFCVAVDSSGRALVFDGQAWSAPAAVGAGAALAAVSCPTSTFCLAVDSAGDVFSYR